MSSPEDDDVIEGREAEDKILLVEPRSSITWRTYAYYALCVLTLGIGYLLLRWFPVAKTRFLKKKGTMGDCDTVLLMAWDGQWVPRPVQIAEVGGVQVERHGSKSKGGEEGEEEVNTSDERLIEDQNGSDQRLPMPPDDSTTSLEASKYIFKKTGTAVIRFFEYRHMRFLYEPQKMQFERCRGLGGEEGRVVIDDVTATHGLDTWAHAMRLAQHGPNDIEVEVKSYYQLLVDEVLHPFYMFQVFSIILWCNEDYYIYAASIFVISLVSVVISVIDTRKNIMDLRNMAKFHTEVTVIRNGAEQVVGSHHLVPGDIFVVPPEGMQLPCDCVLLNGTCIINESMLTGESVPVTKFALPYSGIPDKRFYDEEADKKSTMYCGTAVIQTRHHGNRKVTAMAVRSGFTTAKGELIRSILFPRPDRFKFYEDAFRFVLFLSGLALVGFIYSCWVFARNHVGPEVWIPKALDLITVVVPPALPAAMTVGTIFAIARLKKANIFCIQPTRVNVAGKIKAMVFDKTGTLTEDGLDVWGVLAVTHPSARNEDEDDNDPRLTFSDSESVAEEYVEPARFIAPAHDVHRLPLTEPLLPALACCHTLTTIHGCMVGDPVDVKMFEATGWELEEPAENDESKSDLLVPCIVKPPGTRPFDERAVIGSHRRSHSRARSRSRSRSRLSVDSGSQSSLPQVGPRLSTGPRASVRSAHGSVASRKGSMRSGLSLFALPREFGIVRQFPFSSQLQRMAVIVKSLGEEEMHVYFKGAPEVIRDMCTEESVPEDFSAVLEEYAQDGYRVLALAGKALPGMSWLQAQRVQQESLEEDLEFLGLLILQNRLKPETPGVIEVLNRAKIRCIMCTGDNALTAVSVARDCELLPPENFVYLGTVIPGAKHPEPMVEWREVNNRNWTLDPITLLPRPIPEDEEMRPDAGEKFSYSMAITGRAFSVYRVHFPDALEKLLVRCHIFARMSPDLKTFLVESLQQLDYVVGMCGDGANDCGALKAANVGISLSEAEASVAAPFTSKTPNIECIPKLIREGRAALVTSFDTFKYMALYSFIQFSAILILYWFNSNLGDMQFLWADLISIMPLAFLMGRTGAHKKLVAKRPPGRLVAPAILTSLTLQILVSAGFQFGGYWWLTKQDWYVPLVPDPDIDNTVCQENTMVFYLSSFQYIIMAFAFSTSKPYRKRIYTNGLLMSCLLFLTGAMLYMIVPDSCTLDVMGLVEFPTDARVKIIITVFVNFCLSSVLEMYVLPSRAALAFFRFFKRFRKVRHRNYYRNLMVQYEREERDLVV